jgi:hypothetical protein
LSVTGKEQVTVEVAQAPRETHTKDNQKTEALAGQCLALKKSTCQKGGGCRQGARHQSPQGQSGAGQGRQ